MKICIEIIAKALVADQYICRMATAPKQRYVTVTEEGLDKIIDDKDSKNTKSSLRLSVKILRDYLTWKGVSPAFEENTPAELNKLLSKFWAEVRKQDGKKYKKKSLQTLHFGLRKFLLDTKDIDICDEVVFKKCIQSYKAVHVQLKKEGLGSITHKFVMSKGDVTKLYQGDHPTLNEKTPTGLQNLVFINIMIYFIRRGRENLRDMSRKTYSVKTDGDEREYVSQDIDELDKNHRADNSEVSHGRMYAVPGNSSSHYFL